LVSQEIISSIEIILLTAPLAIAYSCGQMEESAMARARSPEYPAVSLKEAIDRVKMVYDKDYQNRVPKKVIAEHMGYKGLSGASLPMLSALSKYGLLEGRGDETRVSDLAVALIAHAPGTPERMDALKQASAMPELFAELDERFPDGKVSDQAIRSYLLTSKFIPSAADAVIRSYRDTKQFVQMEAAGYNSAPEAELVMQTDPLPTDGNIAAYMAAKRMTPSVDSATKPGVQRAEFPLLEGIARVEFPATLSEASYEEMKDWLELILRRAKRSTLKDEAAN
jgi:hypothetical protein